MPAASRRSTSRSPKPWTGLQTADRPCFCPAGIPRCDAHDARESKTMFGRTFPRPATGLDDSQAADREKTRVRREFWPKFRRLAARLPFAEDLVAAYFCAFDRHTPRQVQVALIGALAYFVLPFDFIPDMMPLIGFTDDAAVLATALRLVAGHITPRHR